jgi:RNA polymerase sigma-70 factor, ECF subfamily
VPGVLTAITLRASHVVEGPDDAIVAAAQADPAAFGAIYERYLPRVYRYLAAKSASPEDAADLTQAVFVKAFDGLGRFRPGPTPFASWLFRIARNASVDQHRRTRPSTSWEFVPDLEGDGADSPETSLLKAERLAQLRIALAGLDRSKRDLLALRYAGGLTVAEIAPLVGKRPEAVKKQLQRILQDLKEHYRDLDG